MQIFKRTMELMDWRDLRVKKEVNTVLKEVPEDKREYRPEQQG